MHRYRPQGHIGHLMVCRDTNTWADVVTDVAGLSHNDNIGGCCHHYVWCLRGCNHDIGRASGVLESGRGGNDLVRRSRGRNSGHQDRLSDGDTPESVSGGRRGYGLQELARLLRLLLRGLLDVNRFHILGIGPVVRVISGVLELTFRGGRGVEASGGAEPAVLLLSGDRGLVTWEQIIEGVAVSLVVLLSVLSGGKSDKVRGWCRREVRNRSHARDRVWSRNCVGL